MMKREFKVGDVYTVERTLFAGTDMNYVLARLNGGVILLEIKEETASKLLGAVKVQRFVFQFVQPGAAEIQFAYQKNGHLVYEEVFPYEVVPAVDNSQVRPGGWSEFAPLTQEDEEAFRSAVKWTGIDFIPVLVNKQIVDGLNYRFFCTTRTVTHPPILGFAMVNIYAKLGEELKVDSIISY